MYTHTIDRASNTVCSVLTMLHTHMTVSVITLLAVPSNCVHTEHASLYVLTDKNVVCYGATKLDIPNQLVS